MVQGRHRRHAAASAGAAGGGLLLDLPVSSHLITLAQALDNKLYAPTGVDTTAVSDWRELFGEPKTLSGLGSLLATVYVSNVDPGQHSNNQNDPAASILKAEQVAEKQAELRRSLGQGVPAGLTRSDLRRLVRDGPHRPDRSSPRGSRRQRLPDHADQAQRHQDQSVRQVPFKIKEGDLILTDDDPQSDRIGYAHLASLTIENDELVAEFSPMTDSAKHNVGSFSMLDGALAAHHHAGHRQAVPGRRSPGVRRAPWGLQSTRPQLRSAGGYRWM